MNTRRMLTVASMLLAFGLAVGGETLRLPVTADTSICIYPAERGFNQGAKTQLRVKGNEHILLYGFDLAPLRGRAVKSARLLMCPVGTHQLKVMGISTVRGPWAEGGSDGPARPGEVCFLEAAAQQRAWSYPGNDFLSVVFTAGGSECAYAELRQEPGGWISVEVPPRLVELAAAGASFGLAVTDEKGQTRANNDIYSREQSGRGPYLVVETDGARPGVAPAPPKLTARPQPELADFRQGAATVEIAWSGTERPLAFVVKVDGKEPPLWQVPAPSEDGKPMQMTLVGQPGTVSTVTAAAMDRWGRLSGAASIPYRFSGARAMPGRLKASVDGKDPKPAAGNAGELRVYVISSLTTVNPVTGEINEGSQGASAPWVDGKVALRVPRGGSALFGLVIEAPAGKLARPSVTVKTTPELALSLHRAWYIPGSDGKLLAGDPLVELPPDGTLEIPDRQNQIAGQRNQTVYVNVQVPSVTPPRRYRTMVSVKAPGELVVPVEVEVADVTLPDRLTFHISLNTYGSPGGKHGARPGSPAFLDEELAWHRLAHANRATIAVVPYWQSGEMEPGGAPAVRMEAGKLRLDWTDWIVHWGKYFDGSAFAGLPRDRVPIDHFYLPLEENWPSPIEANYRWKGPFDDHWRRAGSIEDSFPASYRDDFRDAVRAFVEQASRGNWQQTQFQCYLNNKYDFKQRGRGSSYWLLDEPAHRDDFLALRYFARAFNEGVAAASALPDVKKVFVYRIDLSRPQWRRDYLDGLVGLDVCNTWRAYDRFVFGPARRFNEVVWSYGEAPAPGRPLAETWGWIMEAYAAGADGMVPWQTIGRQDSWSIPEGTAVIYPSRPGTPDGPVASLRLKVLCGVEEDIELLNLLAARRKLDRDQIRQLLWQELALSGTDMRAGPEDAGTALFRSLSAASIEGFRRRLLAALTD